MMTLNPQCLSVAAMLPHPLLAAILLLPLCLSGCVVGDTIAHVAKLANQPDRDSNEAVRPASAEPPPATAPDANPPPAAPAPRDDIRVQELPPPQH
jgi:hypothetical protein